MNSYKATEVVGAAKDGNIYIIIGAPFPPDSITWYLFMGSDIMFISKSSSGSTHRVHDARILKLLNIFLIK